MPDRILRLIRNLSVIIGLLFPHSLFPSGTTAALELGPEEVLRTLVRANAEKDLTTMAKYIAQDPDMISYTIGGRKYVGWSDFAKDMQLEFDSVDRLDIPITELKIWTREQTAWFSMELDYIRYGGHTDNQKTVLPLRETGVLERRNGRWVLVAWHESLRSATDLRATATDGRPPFQNRISTNEKPDLSGEWTIQEEDKTYVATLDRDGNGTYSWQGGRITTTNVRDRRWEGTWHQSGNDREGGFEVLLSEDGMEAKGVWWYTRVGDRANIPPRQWGGPYTWKRTGPSGTPPAAP
jgi:hypothetical protein